MDYVNTQVDNITESVFVIIVHILQKDHLKQLTKEEEEETYGNEQLKIIRRNASAGCGYYNRKFRHLEIFMEAISTPSASRYFYISIKY